MQYIICYATKDGSLEVEIPKEEYMWLQKMLNGASINIIHDRLRGNLFLLDYGQPQQLSHK